MRQRDKANRKDKERDACTKTQKGGADRDTEAMDKDGQIYIRTNREQNGTLTQ